MNQEAQLSKKSFAHSERDRETIRNLKVPVPDNEFHRLSVLHETAVLDTDPMDEEFDRYTALCNRMFKTPMSLVSLVDTDRQWFKSKMGIELPETHRDFSFCSYVVLPGTPDVMVVLDASKDSRFSSNPLVTGPPHIRFYAGAALSVEGEKIGSLCILEDTPRESFSLADQQNLLDIAAIVSQMLSSRRSKNMQSRRLLSQDQNMQCIVDSLHPSCSFFDKAMSALASSMCDHLSSNALIEEGSQLLSCIGTLTGLSQLVQPGSTPIRRNGYQCPMDEIICQLPSLFQCLCHQSSFHFSIDSRFRSKRFLFESFPKVFVSQVLEMLTCLIAFPFDAEVDISFISSGEDLLQLPTREAKHSNGFVKFSLSAHFLNSSDAKRCLEALSTENEYILNCLGGKSSIEKKCQQQSFYYSFWLPISLISKNRNSKDKHYSNCPKDKECLVTSGLSNQDEEMSSELSPKPTKERRNSFLQMFSRSAKICPSQ